MQGWHNGKGPIYLWTIFQLKISLPQSLGGGQGYTKTAHWPLNKSALCRCANLAFSFALLHYYVWLEHPNQCGLFTHRVELCIQRLVLGSQNYYDFRFFNGKNIVRGY